jgi:hypothetical protein
VTLRHFPSEDERRAIAEDLWAYGEDKLAPRAAELSDQELERMGELAGDWALRSATPSGRGMLLAKAIALAAVEVMEGRPRPLQRSRRRSLAKSPFSRG